MFCACDFAAISPSETSWFSFMASVAIGGLAVFLCVGTVVILRVIQFRSRQLKAQTSRNNKKAQEESRNNKNSSGNDTQLESKDVLVDDKDPDIIPSNAALSGDYHNNIHGSLALHKPYHNSIITSV